jgi:hypothetical protein
MLVGTSYVCLYFVPILALLDLAISKVMIDGSGYRGIISGAHNVLPLAVNTLKMCFIAKTSFRRSIHYNGPTNQIPDSYQQCSV